MAWLGEAAALSYQTPDRTPPLWYGMKLALEGQLTAPVATLGPSHHWVRSADQVSPLVPMPLNICWVAPAAPAESPENFAFPLASVLWVPHWLP